MPALLKLVEWGWMVYKRLPNTHMSGSNWGLRPAPFLSTPADTWGKAVQSSVGAFSSPLTNMALIILFFYHFN